MATEMKAKDRGGRPQVTEQKEQPSSSYGTRGLKVVSSFINDATNGYHEETSEEIKRLIKEWEPHLSRQASMADI